MAKNYLFENLKAGDLEDMIRKTVEIDTFKPRLDDKNVVLAFFVSEEPAAYDLSRFIEFSTQNVIDTEVSTIPCYNGDYGVYVEITRPQMAKKIYKILQAVSHLANNKKWLFRAYKRKGSININ